MRDRVATEAVSTGTEWSMVMMTPKKLILAVALSIAAQSRAEVPAAGEARTCCGLTHQEAGLLLRQDVVERVSPLYQITRSGRHLVGAAVTYRPGFGLTLAQLQAAADCQIIEGRLNPSSSPLGVRSVEARARAERDRVRLDITSSDETSAREIVRRATTVFSMAAR